MAKNTYAKRLDATPVRRELPKSYLYFTGTGRENIFREEY